MHKHLDKMGEVTFDKIFNQKLGKSITIVQSRRGRLSISGNGASNQGSRMCGSVS